MRLTNKKVMITGGAGFIGSHLADRLVEQDNEVLVYDIFNTFYGGKEKNATRLEKHPNFHLVRGDILDYGHLRKAMREIEIVFHLAAQPGVRYSLLHPVETNEVNTAGTLNVLEAARANEVEKIVNVSSSSVYGEQKELPIKETAETHPVSPYGASKLAAEYYCRIYYQTYGVNIITLRYFTVYGPRQRPDMAIHKFVKQLYMNTPLTIYGDGTQSRDFTYVDDIVQGTITTAETENIAGEVFNLGSGHRLTLNELLKLIAELMGDFKIKYETKKKGDVAHTQADISKAQRRLGYKPRVDMKEGLSQFIRWHKENMTESIPPQR